MSENTSTSEQISRDDIFDRLHQWKDQELMDLQSDCGEMIHIDAVWDLTDEILAEARDKFANVDEKAGREKSDLMRVVRYTTL